MGISVNIDSVGDKQFNIAKAVKIEHKQPTYYNPISTRLYDIENPTGLIKPEEENENVYTAAEAAAFNAELEGAKSTSDIKTPAVEEVEGVHYTQEEIDAAQEGDDAYGKTTNDWKVEPVEAQAAVYYTQEEADAYNATLPGAVKAGDSKPANP